MERGRVTAIPNKIFKRLAYIYVGTSNYAEDRKFYKETLGADLVWEFEEFGAKVAAFDLCGEPFILIADHVKPPSKRLIYEVDDIEKAARMLKAKGWAPDGRRFEIPDGPCLNFKDKSGNEYAILQMIRPRILEKESRNAG
ncbi:MAG: VOC family protein [Thaumarchaeota archaeon]|nr:VOC family protein [Nitrososphaerota archaeon]